jgi:Cu/Ag efflux pump CusA
VNRAIGWFARNPVAANLLMIVIMAAGLVSATNVKREVFPEFSLDIITVTVPYLGAAPEEVEEGPRPSSTTRVVATPRVGGLHHRYEWREVA